MAITHRGRIWALAAFTRSNTKSCVGTRGDRAKPGTHWNEMLARILIPNFLSRNRILHPQITQIFYRFCVIYE